MDVIDLIDLIIKYLQIIKKHLKNKKIGKWAELT